MISLTRYHITLLNLSSVNQLENAFSLVGLGYQDGLTEFRKCLSIVDGWKVAPEKGKGSTRRPVSGIKAAILETFLM